MVRSNYRTTWLLSAVWAVLAISTSLLWVLSNGSLLTLLVLFFAWSGGVVSAEVVREATRARRTLRVRVEYEDGVPVVVAR